MNACAGTLLSAADGDARCSQQDEPRVRPEIRVLEGRDSYVPRPNGVGCRRFTHCRPALGTL